MGRRSHSRALSLWVDGVHLAQWILRPGGKMELRYADSFSSRLLLPII
ncbi:serine/threonine-protein kinase HipA [Pseudoxanthomonas sp. GM95]|nr:serine/threonine-protein kinase HipA [Pseudoxanthomonas sp. GM95]